jgi:hypothetical protein
VTSRLLESCSQDDTDVAECMRATQRRIEGEESGRRDRAFTWTCARSQSQLTIVSRYKTFIFSYSTLNITNTSNYIVLPPPDPFVQALASTVLNIVSTSHPNTNKYDTQHKSIQQNHQTITSNSSRIPQTAIQPKHRNSTITDPLYPLHPWLTRTAHCRRVTRPRPQRVEINLLILTRFFRM